MAPHAHRSPEGHRSGVKGLLGNRERSDRRKVLDAVEVPHAPASGCGKDGRSPALPAPLPFGENGGAGGSAPGMSRYRDTSQRGVLVTPPSRITLA